MAIIKNKTDSYCWQGCRKHYGEMVRHAGKKLTLKKKTKHMHIMQLSSHTDGAFIPEE